MKKRVLITGAAGGIGTMFREFARDRYDIVCFDRKPTPGVPDAVVADLTDLDALTRAAQGCQAIVHLGAHASTADFLTVILPSNIVGTYNAYEAARLAQVERFVFASTVQVESGNPPGTYITVDMLPQPRNVYAVSKAYGENMGYMYSRRHGLSVICLRFGSVMVPSKVKSILSRWKAPPEIALTARDACEIIRHAIDVEGVEFAVLPGFSRNAAKVRDLSPLTGVIGYTPQEDALEIFKSGERAKGFEP